VLSENIELLRELLSEHAFIQRSIWIEQHHHAAGTIFAYADAGDISDFLAIGRGCNWAQIGV
jgi:hypothetical protein